jgi:hypothetical protein
LHGNNDTNDICWFATSQTMNPRLSQAVVDAAMASDRLKASAEYLNIWREDVSDFVPLDVVEDNTDFETYERPPQPHVQYWAYFDGATGVPGGSSFTMAITHRQGDDVVHDLIRERKPRFVARDVIAEFAQTLKSYNISEIAGDQFAHELFADEWQRNGVRAIEGEFDTSENYRRLLMMLMGRRVKMLNSATLRQQLTSLERHVLPSGNEVIRRPQVASAHDDVATSVAGALVRAGAKRTLFGADAVWLGYDPSPSTPDAAARAAQEESDANFRWRLSQYMRSIGVPNGF